METILYLAHTDAEGALSKASLEALSAAKALAQELSSTFVAGVVAENPAPAINSIADCGATKFVAVAGEEFGQPRYASDAAAAEALCKAVGATMVVAPATSRWSRALPGVAQRLGGRVDTHLTGLGVADGAPEATRWYYRQRMVARLSRTQRPWICTLAPGCAEPYQGETSTASFETIALTLPEQATRTSVERVDAPSADEQTIRPEAELLFVAGAGWTKKQPDGETHVDQASELILGFLDKAKASLGSSKSLVDLSGEGQAVLPFLSHLHQVGQTGSTPRHPKGLATCCHGEEPHVVGWRFITERRAVNLDANCGWAQGKADVLYVADAFEVVKKLNQMLG
jgi:electron transfer flavoprotein alpha subunit